MSLRFHAVASAGACLGGGTKAVCPSVVANSKAKKPTARTTLGVFPCIQAGAYRDMQNWDHHHFLKSYIDTAGSRYSSLAPLYKVCVHIVMIIPWSAGPYCFPEQGNIQNPTEKKKPFPSNCAKTLTNRLDFVLTWPFAPFAARGIFAHTVALSMATLWLCPMKLEPTASNNSPYHDHQPH